MLSKASVCSRSNAGVAGSNPAEGMDVRFVCVCCVGSGHCDGLITHSEESYWVSLIMYDLRNLEKERPRPGIGL